MKQDKTRKEIKRERSQLGIEPSIFCLTGTAPLGSIYLKYFFYLFPIQNETNFS